MRKIATAALLLFLVTPGALAQDKQESRPGIAIDSRGGTVIDPTKNVLDLVLAAVKRLDDLNSQIIQREDDLRRESEKYQNAMRDAETRRLDQLSAQKQAFDFELARILKSNSDAASLLLATQLQEVKKDLSDRTSKLEQYRYENSGSNTGRSDVIAWVVAAFFGLTTIIGLGINILGLIRRPR